MQILELVNTALLLVNIPMIVIFSIWVIALLFPTRKEEAKYRPLITVLIPAYNEEDSIGNCLESILASSYPKDKLEVIVIDDGSTDNTGKIARQFGVKVIRTRHVGKGKALNTGLKRAKGEIILVIDSDVLLERDALAKIAGGFEDPRVGIVSGLVRIRGKSIVERFQKIEFAFVSTMIKGHDNAGFPVPFIYGAVSAFRKKALDEIGGFKWETIAEDSDTYLELVFGGWKARTVSARVYTEPVRPWRALIRQRKRWMLGGLQVLARHVGNLGKGIAGFYVLPLFGFWPFGAGMSLILNFYVFAYWFRAKTAQEAIVYILRWISFIGVPMGLHDLPSWGFPIAATTGILVGLLSMVSLALGIARSGEDMDLIDSFLAVFYPVYGWIILGSAGVFGLIEFLFKRRGSFRK